MTLRNRVHRAEHGRTRIWALLLAFGTFVSQVILLTPNLALAAVPVVTPDGYSVVQDGSLSVDWWDADWTKRRKVVFDNSLQGSDLDDFPVLVEIPGATFDYGQTQNLGQDLRFIDATGAPLSHEIEVWNESGDSFVWVKVPRIDAGSMTDSIWMYYGNNLALAREDAAGVWSNGYVGVWHFDEDPAGGAGSIKDSTSHANHGDPFNMDASNLQAGAIGTGLYFPGTTPNPDYVRVASSGSDELSINGTQLTLEAWARQTGDTGAWSVIVGRQLGLGSGDSYALATKYNAPNRPVIIAGGSVEGPGALPVNTWRYVAGVRDGGDLTLYANGGQVGQLTGLGTSIGTDVNDVTLGAAENDATVVPIEPWLGQLDEVRISDVARTADWVRAQNLSMTGALAALQAEQDAPAVDGVLGNDDDPEDDPLTAILVSPPSQALGFTFRDDGTFLYTPNPGYSGPDSFDYKVNDGSGDSITVTAAITVVGGISGRVFEDVDGNLLAGGEVISDADNPIVVGAIVHVYADNGTTPDAPDASDTPIAGSPFTTGPAGFYTTGSASDGKYWVVVDSKTVPASQDPTESQSNIWAEQTYGWIGSLCADGAGGTAGPSPSSGCYGGRRADQSDDLTAWHSGAEHIASVVISGGFAVPNVDFGFSFNVVTNTLAGDTRDDDGGAIGRVVQGSLRQFMTNANALAGANSMRLVPAEPTNAAGSGGNWWRIDVTAALPPVNDADTTIDGTAYDSTGLVRDDNPGAVGTGGTVGVDGVPLVQVPRSELQIDGAGLVIIDDGGGLVPHRATVRALSITEAGAQAIRVNNISQVAPVADDLLLEDLIIGMPPLWQPQTLPTGTAAGIHLNATNRAIIRDSFIGWTNGRTLNVETSTDSTISGSEFRDTNEDVLDLYEASTGTLFENNLVSGGLNWGIDLISGYTTIRNNTIDGAGDGVGQSGGIRAYGPGVTIDRNVFSNNPGPAIAVNGTMTATPRVAGEVVITRNHFTNNDGLAIDIVPATEDNLLSGDGITPNNGGATDPSHGNHDLDFPVIASATVSGGTTTVTGTACPGCTVEIYEAVGGTGDDDPPASGTNYHGEGLAYLGSGVATGGAFSVDVTGLVAGDSVSATATDTGFASTSEFALNETVVTLYGVSGTIFEDKVGDGLADGPLGVGANPFESGVRIELHRDGGDNRPDGVDDVYQGFTVSALADGTYSFSGLMPGIYWVTVHSQGVYDGPLNAGYTGFDTWAEQTYGPAGSAGFDGSNWSFSGVAGSHYGGARWDVSDDFTPTASLPGAEHIARTDVTSGSQTNIDFGFSFNVVTTTRGASAAQDPGAGAGQRTVQGSLRQFLTNAAAQSDPNPMRFVPAAPLNDGTWWEILITDALPAIDDELTQIDGTAYDVADGVTVRDTNPGYLGANAAGGLTVGVDGLALTQVERPELEIQGDQAAALPPQFGLEILASQTTVRELALLGFGDTLTAGLDSDIRVGPSVTPLEGIVLERLVIGSAPDTFADPGVGTRSQGTGIRVSDAVSGGGILDNVLSDSLVGFVRSTGVLVNNDTGGWIVSGNEIRDAGIDPFSGRPDGLSVEGGGSTSHSIIGNLIAGSSRVGIETWRSDGGHSIANNDVLNSSVGVVDETAGIRLSGVGSTVEKNRISGGDGPGIIVIGENTASPHVASIDNRISQNEFGSNTGLAIDLVASTIDGTQHSTGDGLTLTAGTDAGTGNNGLDAPAITTATSASVSGTACAACRVELYRAVSGAGDGGYGEGLEFLGFDVADGSGNWAVSGVTAALVGQDVSAIAIDASNDTSEFGLNVTVVASNTAPVADPIADRVVNELTLLSSTATATDTDVPADILTWSQDSGPGSVLPNGAYSWTPTEAQGPGVYTVVLRVTDNGTGNLDDTVSFDVTVNEVNLAPVLDAVGDRVVDEVVGLGFTATASDPDDPANLLAFSLSGAPVGASITAGGVFSWTPTEAQGPGSYVFDVVVTETNGSPSNLSDSETITVTVGEVNLAPVLNFVGNRAVDELVNLSFAASASDPDDPANLLSFSLSGAPAGASITAGGVFSWTPAEAQGPGSYVFDVVVTETNGSPSNLSDSETITVTVGEVNVAPVADAIADTSVDELTSLSFAATGSDADVPANTLAWSLDSGPGFILPNGNYTWTPTEAQGPGIYTVTLRVSDNGTPSLSDTVSFDVTVNEVNLAPVLDAVGDRVVDELVGLGFTATASDPDDPANLLAFSLSGAPVGASITAGGVFSWTPTEAQGPGSYVFDVVVTETNGSPSNLSDSETITVTVGEVNLAPVLNFVGNRAVDELTALAFTATASDPDDPANTLVFSLSGAPVGASITAGGVFSWTPTEAQGPGSYVFDVVVTETNGAPSNLSDSETIAVTVNEVNLAPVLDPVGDRSVAETTLLSFTATASDPDDPANLLAFSLSGAPVGASITAGGVFSWTPAEAQGPGSYVFDVVVTETNGSPSNLSDSETITVTVGEVNVAPVLNFVGNRAVDELVNLSFAATGSDPDDPANLLIFSLSGAPAGASITAGGVFSWTPTEAQGPGVFSFDVVVTETNGLPTNLSDSESISVTVGEDNLAPTLNPVGNQTINELVPLSFTATASDPDAPVNTLLFSLTGEPVGAIIDPNTGAFSWTPTEAQGPGSYVFDVIVTDDGAPGLNDSETITVTVNEINLAPVLDPVGDRSVDELVNLSFTATASDPDTPANTLTFSLSGAPAGASITAGGAFSWTPTETQGPGSYVVDVIVTETNGSPTNLTDTETITITINEINLPPLTAPIADVTMDERTLLSLTAAAIDPDIPANTLAWSIDAGPGVVLPTGEYSWFPTEADGPGVYPLTLRVTDSGVPSQADTVSFTVTVDEVNSPPVVLASAYTVDEGGTAAPGPAAGVLAGAFDAEGDPISAILDTGPAFGSLALLADGSFVYEHDGSENFIDGFTFRAADGIDMSAPIAVTMTVNPLNDIPVIAGTTFAADEGTAAGTVLGAPVASDADGDSLVFAFVSPDSTFSIDSLTGTISLAGVLDFETVPSFTLDVSATDASGASAVAPVMITVGDIDELPVAAPAAFPVVESLPIGSTLGVVAGSDPEGEPVSFSLVGGDPAGQFTIDPTTGELIVVAALDADTTPSYVLNIVVTDPGGNAASTSAIVLVSPAALLPPINASPLGLPDLVTLDEDTFATLAPLSNDTDPDGDPLFVTWIDSPINGTLTANGDGTYTYRPDPDFNGAETLAYGISDGRGGLDTAEVVLAIMAVNDPPVAPNFDTVLEFTPKLEIPIPSGIYDPEGDPVAISVGTPGTGTVTLTDGIFTYVPPPEWNGTDTFTYVVVDSGGSSSTGLVTIRVTQIDGDLVAIDLVSVEDVDAPPKGPSTGIVVDSIKLLVGTVGEMAGLLGIPLLAVGVAFLASVLFGFSRNFLIGRGPVFLPATGPGTVGIVRVPAGAIVTALEGPGEEYPLVHRYQPAESGIRATGRQAQRGSTRWVEVETPEGDGWVIGRFVTATVPAGTFSGDANVRAAIEAIRRTIVDRGDVSPLVASYGLEVAFYAPSKHFADDELAGLLAGDASWGWWDPTGSVPSVRGEFAAIVADPLAEALATLEGRAVAEAVVEIPVELVNFPSLTFTEPDHLGWRVFFEYEDEVPKLAAIWREGVTNPASL